MKIFFTAAVQGRPQFEPTYRHIVLKMEALGHAVSSDSLFLVPEEKIMADQGAQELLAYQKRVIDNLKKADVFVVEATVQRVSTGYWISMALELGKPIIVFCKAGEKYHLLEILEISQKLTLYQYDTLEELDKELPLLLDFAAEQRDTRFNFFISPKHQNYLDWIAHNKKTPRSVYLRELIESDMLKNIEFLENELVPQVKAQRKYSSQS